MPKPNRVSPSGEILAIPDRGTVMGNRGRLHDDHGRIRRAWQVTRWILCQLEFQGRHRPVMASGRYTELFFLDEATGLAAGHRPCFECRRGSFLAFAEAWAVANLGAAGRPLAGAIDERLHAERLSPTGSKRTFRASLDDLPDGVIVNRDRPDGGPQLLWREELLAWSPGGYRARRPRPRGEWVTVLTPGSTVNVLRSGYATGVHPSAGLL